MFSWICNSLTYFNYGVHATKINQRRLFKYCVFHLLSLNCIPIDLMQPFGQSWGLLMNNLIHFLWNLTLLWSEVNKLKLFLLKTTNEINLKWPETINTEIFKTCWLRTKGNTNLKFVQWVVISICFPRCSGNFWKLKI